MDKYFPVKTEVKYKVRSQRGLPQVWFSSIFSLMTAKIMEWKCHFIELVGDTMLEALTSTLQESKLKIVLINWENGPKSTRGN